MSPRRDPGDDRLAQIGTYLAIRNALEETGRERLARRLGWLLERREQTGMDVVAGRVASDALAALDGPADPETVLREVGTYAATVMAASLPAGAAEAAGIAVTR